MRSLFVLALSALVPLAARAQEEKKAPEPIKVPELKRTDPVSYDKEVEPIFYKRCVVCHSGREKEAKFDIASYEGLIKGGKRGNSITPGKSDTSLMYKLITRQQKPYMPPKGEEPITPQEIAIVKLWIDQGAKAPTGVRERPKIVVGVPPANVHPVRAVAVSADGKTIAGARGNQVHLYDGAKGDFLRTLADPNLKTADSKQVKASHLSLVESLAFSPDGKFLVSGGFQEIAIWDPASGKQLQKIPGFAHSVVALAFSQDGKLLGVAGGEPTVEGEVKVFEVGSWKKIMEVKNGHSDTVYGLCFSPDGKMVATGSADKFVKVWEVPSGKFVKSFEGHTHHVLDVGWMADGKLLASAGGDNTVKVWDFDKGEQARTINAHTKQVTRLMFIGKKAEFITAGGDNQVKAFNASNGGNVRNFPGNTDFVYAIGVGADGAVVAAGGEEGVVRLYNGNNGQLVRALLPPDAQPPMTEKKK
jgi:WD40 repeat protein